MIEIVGLGRKEGDLTVRQIEAIGAADRVYSKTRCHPAAEYIAGAAKEIRFLDDIYETSEDFDQLNRALATRVAASKKENAVYCVPGSGLGDRSVAELRRLAECKLIPGVADAAEDLFVAMATEYTILSATEFCERKKNLFDTNLPLVLLELNDPYLAADVKIKLQDLYGDNPPIVLNGEPATLKALDRKSGYTDETALIVMPRPLVEKERYTFGDLTEVIYRLCDPDGCQWDRAQTHRTIRGNALEEAYELVEAVDLDDLNKMREESGDVLLQGLFHAIIADGRGEFNVNDMITELTLKLITRHTHIFGENTAHNETEALAFWEAAKAKEKGYLTLKDKFDSVPKTFGALMYASKIQKYSSKAGYDFKTEEAAAVKIPKEIAEFFEETDPVRREAEGGDVLFAAVNVLRKSGIDPEIALCRATANYRRRVESAEALLAERGRALSDCTEEELDAVWREVKRIVND